MVSIHSSSAIAPSDIRGDIRGGLDNSRHDLQKHLIIRTEQLSRVIEYWTEGR
jgi:hypothetical protein